MKNVSLYFKEGSSNKVYFIQLDKSDDGFFVNFQYGRRGNSLISGTKTPTPVPETEAIKIYDKLEKEKRAKGYKTIIDCEQTEFSGEISPEKSKEVIMLPQLLNEITIEDVERLINDDNWLLQEKFDGNRRMIISNGQVIGLNKKGTKIGLSNIISNSIKGINCILDGEAIGEKFIVFDLLSKEGEDLKSIPCIQRISYLNFLEVLSGNRIIIAKTAYSTKEKHDMFNRIKENNGEGVVFKLKSAPYTHGRPNSGGNCLKFKFKKSCTCIVANITKGKRSVGLEVMDGNKKVYIGKVSVPVNRELPKINDLIEVEYLYAFPNGGCLFHPVFKESRDDADLTDAVIEKLVYKAGV